MKGSAPLLLLLLLALCARAASANGAGLSLASSLLGAAQSAMKSLAGNKGSIASIMDVFKGEKGEKGEKGGEAARPNVVVDSPEGKIELTIDLARKETSDSVDGRYTMEHFRAALADIKLQLGPVAQIELDVQAKAEPGDALDRSGGAALNRSIAKFAGEFYASVDLVKRDAVVLEANLAALRDPAFRVADFYFNGFYAELEQRVRGPAEPGLAEARTAYTLERAKLMWNVADAVKFLAMMNSNFEGLFSFHKKLMYYYVTARNRGDSLKELDEGVLLDLKSLFDLRVHIAENIEFITREIDAFEEYKDAFQHIFETADRKVEQMQVQQAAMLDSGINDEEYFRRKEAETEKRSQQYKIENELAEGKISMQDIADADMADQIIEHPLLNSLPGGGSGLNSLSFGII